MSFKARTQGQQIMAAMLGQGRSDRMERGMEAKGGVVLDSDHTEAVQGIETASPGCSSNVFEINNAIT